MNKEIEKYVWYYLAVYIVVLVIYAFFDYIISCSGKSLECKVDWTNVKDILQTTAYILTPIVAIVGFLSWKEQKEYEKEYDKVDDVLKTIATVELNLKTYLSYLKSFAESFKKDKVIFIFDSNIVDLSFHQKFNEEFNLKLKLLNTFSENSELEKLSSEYHEKVCESLSIPLQHIFSMYFHSINNIDVNKVKFSIAGIILDDKIYDHIIEIKSLSQKELLELIKNNNSKLEGLDFDFFNDFISKLDTEYAKLQSQYSTLIMNESKKLKNELYKIKKIPCSN